LAQARLLPSGFVSFAKNNMADASVGEVYVVTGATRGIGFGLARELLQRGQRVFICGRSKSSVTEALEKLNAGDRVGGIPCDIALLEDVQRLWDAAISKFGRVDVFINNAGMAPHATLLDVNPDQLASCVDINVKGALYCCRVAIKGMQQQEPSGGRVYLTEGAGSDGRVVSSESIVYGMTKYAGSYLANAMEGELKKASSNVRIGRLSPGMVTTELLLDTLSKDPEEAAKTKKIINILADKETTVTPWLADQLVHGEMIIRWLTPMTIVGRFLRAPFSSRNLFEDKDNTASASGC